MKNDNQSMLAATVDRLAQVKADAAKLATEEKQLKQALVDSGLSVIEGTLHRVSVSHSDGRAVTNWQAVAARFNPSHQLITAHTTTGDAFATVRMSARKGV